MKYINMKSVYGTETVDQFDTMKEAREMVKEYNMSDSQSNYYISSRCTKEWRERA